jgi:hypothetical protein
MVPGHDDFCLDNAYHAAIEAYPAFTHRELQLVALRFLDEGTPECTCAPAGRGRFDDDWPSRSY